MYTQIDDLKHANLIKEYLEQNPAATRADLTTALRFNHRRLIQLDKIGAIVLPEATPRGKRNKTKTDRL
jgi:hypothetical protein